MRERFVTRTIVTTEYVCMTVNMETKQVEEISVSIPSADSLSDKAKEKVIKATLPPMNTFVQVMAEKETKQLYGMSEVDFLKYAKLMPPRTTGEFEA